MLIILVYLAYSPLFDIGFYDEDDWYHLNFGKNIAQNGFFKANVFEMLISTPELSVEHIRMIYFTQMWWAYNYEIWGSVARGHHLSAFLLLLFCVFLVFSITRQLTRSWLTAMGAATLFALSPFNARLIGSATAVVYLVLTTSFLLSMVFYLAYLRAKRMVLFSKARTGAYYVLSLLFFILAVMTQESAYGLPVMLLFTDIIYTAADSRFTLKKTILRIAPFFVAICGVIATTIYYTFTLKSLDNIEGRFTDFIGLPLWKYFTVVPEGLFTPFYQGFLDNPGVKYLAIGFAGIIFLTAFISFSKQRKLVLLMGLSWIIIGLLPALQVIDRVIDPVEGEEKYLFLPAIGFFLIVATCATGGKGVNRRLRIIALCSMAGLAFTYLLGLNYNSRYFLTEGKKYERVYSGLKDIMENSKGKDIFLFLYGDNQPDRERMLASFLEYTFLKSRVRPWFFIDKAFLLSVTHGKLPDLTTPLPTLNITDVVGVNSQNQGGLKYPDRFLPIMFNYDQSLHIMCIEPDTFKLIDAGQELLPHLLEILTPAYVDMERFSSVGPPTITEGSKAAGPIDKWILIGNVFRLFPVHGRFSPY